MIVATGVPSPDGRPVSHRPVAVAGHTFPTQAHGKSRSDRDSAAVRPGPPRGGRRAPNERKPCINCGASTELEWYENSGGLCGVCLADYGFMGRVGGGEQ